MCKFKGVITSEKGLVSTRNNLDLMIICFYLLFLLGKYADLRIEDLTGHGSFPGYGSPSNKYCRNHCGKPGYGTFPRYENIPVPHSEHQVECY